MTVQAICHFYPAANANDVLKNLWLTNETINFEYGSSFQAKETMNVPWVEFRAALGIPEELEFPAFTSYIGQRDAQMFRFDGKKETEWLKCRNANGDTVHIGIVTQKGFQEDPNRNSFKPKCDLD